VTDNNEQNFNVKVQTGSAGLIKCKYTPNNGILPVKFKINILPNASKVGIRLTHQQGPEKGFDDIAMRLTYFLTYQSDVLAQPNQDTEFDESPVNPIVIC
jgi:hypothetical protein